MNKKNENNYRKIADETKRLEEIIDDKQALQSFINSTEIEISAVCQILILMFDRIEKYKERIQKIEKILEAIGYEISNISNEKIESECE